MSGLYPMGRVLDSGIYDYDTEGETDCENCGRFVATTLTWRGPTYRFQCPECGADGEGSL